MLKSPVAATDSGLHADCVKKITYSVANVVEKMDKGCSKQTRDLVD